jgi:hypothetical protein
MNDIGMNKIRREIDWLFWASILLMMIGYAIPGVGVIGAQILMLR